MAEPQLPDEKTAASGDIQRPDFPPEVILEKIQFAAADINAAEIVVDLGNSVCQRVAEKFVEMPHHIIVIQL